MIRFCPRPCFSFGNCCALWVCPMVVGYGCKEAPAGVEESVQVVRIGCALDERGSLAGCYEAGTCFRCLVAFIDFALFFVLEWHHWSACH